MTNSKPITKSQKKPFLFSKFADQISDLKVSSSINAFDFLNFQNLVKNTTYFDNRSNFTRIDARVMAPALQQSSEKFSSKPLTNEKKDFSSYQFSRHLSDKFF